MVRKTSGFRYGINLPRNQFKASKYCPRHSTFVQSSKKASPRRSRMHPLRQGSLLIEAVMLPQKGHTFVEEVDSSCSTTKCLARLAYIELEPSGLGIEVVVGSEVS
jgi:hypothetical protein